MTSDNNLSILKKKTQYRAWHRGMLELDLVLGKFADLNIEKFDFSELKSFSKILKLNDNILVNICMTNDPLPEKLDDTEIILCKKIREVHSTSITK